MNELHTPQKSKNNGARAAVTVTALAAALGTGYALRGPQVTAQNTDTAPAAATTTKAPVVQTPATNDAASMQHAFNAVSKAIEPAVVTIVTEGSPKPASARGQMRPMPGMPGQGGGNDQGDLEEFFKRFRDFGFAPNSTQKDQVREYFRRLQDEGEGSGGGLGSGMIYRADGYIITNAHVVRGAKTVAVKMNDGREFKRAKVVGSDDRTDIAVVKIDGTNLPFVKLGDSNNVNVGDWAIAVGNPFGLEHTVTVGVISAKAREVPLDARSPGDYLQTDASINPGNSGGPLCDIYGRVIGVNNAIYSRSGGNVGIGFAIPIDTAKGIAERLVKDGKIVRGYLGVEITGVEDADTARGLGLDEATRGVLINNIGDGTGPGAKAGLQPGDVVTAFNGKTVTRSPELQRLVGDAPVDADVTLTVLRDGRTLQLKARLAELKDEAAPTEKTAPEAPAEAAPAANSLGMGLSALTPRIASQLRIEATKGVAILRVQPDSAAGKAGLQRGDVIERVGQTTVNTPAEYQAAVQRILAPQKGEDKTVGLYVNRAGKSRFFFLNVD